MFLQFWEKIWQKYLFHKESSHKPCPQFCVKTNPQISRKAQRNQDPDLHTFSSAQVSIG